MTLERSLVRPREPVRPTEHRPDIPVELDFGIRDERLGRFVVDVFDDVPERRRRVDPPRKVRRANDHIRLVPRVSPSSKKIKVNYT